MLPTRPPKPAKVDVLLRTSAFRPPFLVICLPQLRFYGVFLTALIQLQRYPDSPKMHSRCVIINTFNLKNSGNLLGLSYLVVTTDMFFFSLLKRKAATERPFEVSGGSECFSYILSSPCYMDWIGLTVGYWCFHYSKDCSRAQNPSL